MAAQGNLTLAGNVSGGADGARSFGPLTITANTAVTQTVAVPLISGATTVTIPSGATAAVFLPPNVANPTSTSTYTGTLTLKGVSGDTGVAVSNKWPTLLSFDTAGASFVVTATAVGTATVWFI